MKLTLLQFICFGFVLGWVGSEVLGGSYNDKLFCGLLIASSIAYLENLHGIIWKRIKALRA